MRVAAIHLGKQISLKSIQSKLDFKASYKEPLVIEYSKARFIVVFKYGVVVFWGITPGDMNKFLLTISPFIVDHFDDKFEEDLTLKVGRKIDQIKDDQIHLSFLSVEKIALVSMILARSLALERFEQQVEKILKDFELVVNNFTEKGRIGFSGKYLLKKVGMAMSLQHGAVSQLALLDKPDLTWNDLELDRLYNRLEEEFELDDRYQIAAEKLKMLFHNVEFILNLLSERRGVILELIIIFLILIEVLFFIYETWIL